MTAERYLTRRLPSAFAKTRYEGDGYIEYVLGSDYDHLQRGFNAAIATVEAERAKVAQLEAALQRIKTNELTSSSPLGSLHASGISLGLKMQADIASEALNKSSMTETSAKPLRVMGSGDTPAEVMADFDENWSETEVPER
jgi:hypothetical protein